MIVKLTATATNPVDFGAVVMVAAGYYGLCVAASMIGATGKLVSMQYDLSKKEKADLHVKGRIRDTFERVVGKSSELKGEAVKAVTGCATKLLSH
jgi:hypothetical protein